MPAPSMFDFGPEPDDRGLDGAAAGPPLLSVSDLTAMVREVLESGFADVGVSGEISNLSEPKSGHVYFDLKDGGAKIRAVMWRTQARRVPFELHDGLAVHAWGGIDVYPPHGAYQLIVRKVEPEGIGPLELAFRQLCDRLRLEGLFDPDRKRPLPRFPGRIVVVTSPTGAAIRDILNITGRRWPAAEVLIAPAKVQGNGAGEEVAAAIALANRVKGADLLIVARGGGSLEDLWAFNTEEVARAIAASALPVISGVGHETDLTVADLVADARAPTPSGAAELAVPDYREILGRLDGHAQRLARALSLRALDARNRVDSHAARADQAIARLLDRLGDRLAAHAGRLEALSPLAVLSRGYSLTLRDSDGRIVRDSGDAPAGTLLRTRFASGTILSRVEPDAALAPVLRTSKRNRRPAPVAPSRTDPERS